MHSPVEINRRTALHGIMLLLGAVSAPGCAYLPGSSEKTALPALQRQLLDLVADVMIPQTDTAGALKSGTPQRLAAMYRDWASDETRDQLSGALDRLAKSALDSTQKTFAALSAAQRLAFLQGHDAAALKPVPRKPGAPEGSFFAPIPSVVDVGYHRLKQLILALHYTSEAALTSELVYDHVPGPWEPSIKVTPGMRPAASIGPF
ncbi:MULTISPECIES: gluconate 2-dehydrogenase subunit 3 family protein [unclassified Novosphingobium]|uniref:gluconate 2-dehydrogenase subunit 3 family protein n=1 Tax=unclassified Novosphingobium TaxID=2644732 RepID=UPI0025FAE7EA|nr:MULTISPECIES: gluconate 2-dehydrogenase subunit 3 family protein [unclassified Novosphingobium]HQS68587.1 gluconate 2-dehydrogenase subunit 3 family protein [Novosphingobium sp.]